MHPWWANQYYRTFLSTNSASVATASLLVFIPEDDEDDGDDDTGAVLIVDWCVLLCGVDTVSGGGSGEEVECYRLHW